MISIVVFWPKGVLRVKEKGMSVLVWSVIVTGMNNIYPYERNELYF